MAYSDELTGIGGWMMLFLFGFGFVSPITLVYGTTTNLYGDPGVATLLGDRWLAFQIAEWMIVGFGLATIATIVWRLFNIQNWRTVRLTTFAIPFVALGLALLDIAVTAVVGNMAVGPLFSALGIELVRGAIYSVIWCSYFNVSKRVRNTFADQAPDEAALVFE